MTELTTPLDVTDKKFSAFSSGFKRISSDQRYSIKTKLKNSRHRIQVRLHKALFNVPIIKGMQLSKTYRATQLSVTIRAIHKGSKYNKHFQSPKTWGSAVLFGIGSLDTRFVCDVDLNILKTAEIVELHISYTVQLEKATVELFSVVDIQPQIRRWEAEEDVYLQNLLYGQKLDTGVPVIYVDTNFEPNFHVKSKDHLRTKILLLRENISHNSAWNFLTMIILMVTLRPHVLNVFLEFLRVATRQKWLNIIMSVTSIYLPIENLSKP